MPLNAIQSFEAITGAPPPEYGDKASLVVTAVTKSGLNATKPFGSFTASYGSFGTASENFAFGDGNARIGISLRRILRGRAVISTPRNSGRSTTSGITSSSSTAWICRPARTIQST
jgi:hypothetical protein